MIFMFLLFLMFVSIVVDVESTLAVLKRGGIELNPVMRAVFKFANNSRFPVYCMQVAVQCGIVAVAKHFGSLAADAAMISTAAVHFYAGAGNLRQL